MKEAKSKTGVLMILGSLVVVFSMTAVSAYLKHLNEYDALTLCPKNRSYNHNVVIVDKTDPWQETDVESLKGLLKVSHANVKMNDRFTVKVIRSGSDGATEVNALFDLCNPGKESDANPLYQNPVKFRKKYQNKFDEPFSSLSEILTKSDVAPKSPLLNVFVTTINESMGENIELTIVSDLFENGDSYNFYEHIPQGTDWVLENEIKKTNVDIDIKYIDRQSYRASAKDKVRQQWLEYFKHWNIHANQETFMKVKH